MNCFSTLILALIVGSLAVTPTANAAGSGGGATPPTTFDNNKRALSPEELSMKAFNSGIKYRDRALKQEAKAASAKSEKAAAKALARAQKQYKKAVDKQAEALRVDPQNYKAANELGFALRKTGDFRKAIGAYNYALELNPNYHQATEYRAEAFLALGLLKHTMNSYMVLFRENRKLAQQLMASFDAWAAERQELTAEEQEFVAWVAERKRIAKLSRGLSWHDSNATLWSAPSGG